MPWTDSSGLACCGGGTTSSERSGGGVGKRPPWLRVSAGRTTRLLRPYTMGVSSRYAWSSLDGRFVYAKHARLLRNDPVIARSLEVAADGLRRAAGPHALGHPKYLMCWWEWVTGSTLFFWN